MSQSRSASLIAFHGDCLLAQGSRSEVVAAAKAAADLGASGLFVLDAVTSRAVDIDFRGGLTEVLRRLETVQADAPKSRGRPKLGVAAREVTLLPRHWEWLADQPGGASVALRKLVEAARRDPLGDERRRLAQESANRFATTMAGNRPGYEEAMRALFAGDHQAFTDLTGHWPADIRDHLRALAVPAFEA